MARCVSLGIIAIVLILSASLGVEAFVFTDPTEFYSTLIQNQWVYQAQQSTAQLIVFYGEDDLDLLYFERLGIVPDASAQELAERSLQLYESPGGLTEYKLERSPREIDVAGQNGALCVYTYKNSHGNTLWEFRIFFVLPQQEGFSIALSGTGDWAYEDPPLLTDILSHWRWLF